MQFWFRGCQIGLSQGPYLAGIRDSGAAPRPESSPVVQTGQIGRFCFARRICESLVGPDAAGRRQAVPDAAELRRRRAWEHRNGERSLDEPGADRMLRAWQRYENFCTRGIA